MLAEFEEELAKARAELPPHAAEPDTERYEPSVAGEVPDVREVHGAATTSCRGTCGQRAAKGA